MLTVNIQTSGGETLVLAKSVNAYDHPKNPALRNRVHGQYDVVEITHKDDTTFDITHDCTVFVMNEEGKTIAKYYVMSEEDINVSSDLETAA